MRQEITIVPNQEEQMKTYAFKVVVELDEDRWVAYCPVLKNKGGATWGYTKEEALKNIKEVVEMTIESMIEHHEPIPEEPREDVKIFDIPLVSCHGLNDILKTKPAGVKMISNGLGF
jgi:predicted RNase H-like HicB family nuclease